MDVEFDNYDLESQELIHLEIMSDNYKKKGRITSTLYNLIILLFLAHLIQPFSLGFLATVTVVTLFSLS
jgi:hypothetical protein